MQEITLPPVMKFAELTNEVEKEIKLTSKEEALINSTKNFEEFMRNSCYHLELDAPNKSTVNDEHLCCMGQIFCLFYTAYN
jgi:hypothetical protein